MGKREANRREKLQRIRKAARELFTERGYEGATIRDIADRAGVATGTIFLYAPSKQALAVMVFDEDTRRVMEEALLTLDRSASPVDQLTHMLGSFLRLFADQPGLTRALLRQISFAAPEEDEAHPALHAENLIRPLAMLLTMWKAQGLVRADVDPDLAAVTIVAIHYQHILAVLSEALGPVDEVVEHLRAAFELAFEGIAPG